MFPRSTSTFDLVAQGRAAVAGGDFDGALGALADFVATLHDHPVSAGRLYADRLLDGHCFEIGAEFLKASGIGPTGHWDGDVYLTTSIGPTGGHTRVIEDLVRARRRPCLVVLTDAATTPRSGEAIGAMESLGAEVAVAPADAPSVRLRWLLSLLASRHGAEVWLFNHHHDAVAVAACQPGIVARLCYVHHADHHLALGVHHPHAHHIDLSPFSFHHCRRALGLAGHSYLPIIFDPAALGLEGIGRPPDGERFVLRTACSGSFTKFEYPYAWRYIDLLPRILAAGGGEHHHIGAIPPPELESIRARLEDAGIDPERFVYQERVPCLAGALKAAGIHLYLQSFPVVGYKSGIEAMAAGIGVALHRHYSIPHFSGIDMTYPEAPQWSGPEELESLLRSFGRAEAERHGRLARDHFENAHSPGALARHLAALASGEPVAAPPEPEDYPLNPVQAFVDEIVLTRRIVESPSLAGGEVKAAWRELKAKLDEARAKRHEAEKNLRLLKASPLGRLAARLSRNRTS